MGFFLKEEKSRKQLLRGVKTVFFLVTMLISLLLFSAPVLLVIADTLLPSALLSAAVSSASLSLETLYIHLTNYDFRYSLIDIPLISIVRCLQLVRWTEALPGTLSGNHCSVFGLLSIVCLAQGPFRVHRPVAGARWIYQGCGDDPFHLLLPLGRCSYHRGLQDQLQRKKEASCLQDRHRIRLSMQERVWKIPKDSPSDWLMDGAPQFWNSGGSQENI
ncbi:hypothetical protein SAY87_018930 [Trapa incisa]|uniref:Uncharacterized protein n=1 Tax=Trapa incisa TaxID=236973 RepID=A0AAN7K1H2_9MYRT|nr:hypothetical protein SAY87_018930 [Trapa incisa]